MGFRRSAERLCCRTRVGVGREMLADLMPNPASRSGDRRPVRYLLSATVALQRARGELYNFLSAEAPFPSLTHLVAGALHGRPPLAREALISNVFPPPFGTMKPKPRCNSRGCIVP